MMNPKPKSETNPARLFQQMVGISAQRAKIRAQISQSQHLLLRLLHKQTQRIREKERERSCWKYFITEIAPQRKERPKCLMAQCRERKRNDGCEGIRKEKGPELLGEALMADKACFDYLLPHCELLC